VAAPVNEPRDSEDGTIEEEEVMAGQSDAYTSNERTEGYGVGHHDRTEQQQRLGKRFPSRNAYELPRWGSRAQRRQVDK